MSPGLALGLFASLAWGFVDVAGAVASRRIGSLRMHVSGARGSLASAPFRPCSTRTSVLVFDVRWLDHPTSPRPLRRSRLAGARQLRGEVASSRRWSMVRSPWHPRRCRWTTPTSQRDPLPASFRWNPPHRRHCRLSLPGHGRSRMRTHRPHRVPGTRCDPRAGWRCHARPPSPSTATPRPARPRLRCDLQQRHRRRRRDRRLARPCPGLRPGGGGRPRDPARMAGRAHPRRPR